MQRHHNKYTSITCLVHISQVGLEDEARRQDNIACTHSHPRVSKQGFAPGTVHVLDGENGNNHINDAKARRGEFGIRHVGLSKDHGGIVKDRVNTYDKLRDLNVRGCFNTYFDGPRSSDGKKTSTAQQPLPENCIMS